ncbi:hypothetical protein BDD12DRAFT_902569 [Trichophaea hybrida]|nr:hypothetical protein BDD12DRAFT_902569 [Trichophaea hybrida]
MPKITITSTMIIMLEEMLMIGIPEMLFQEDSDVNRSVERVTGHDGLTPEITFARSINERNCIRMIDKLVRRLGKAEALYQKHIDSLSPTINTFNQIHLTMKGAEALKRSYESQYSTSTEVHARRTITRARKCIYRSRLHEHGNAYMENDGTYDRKIAITTPLDIGFMPGGSLLHRKSMSMQLPHATEIQDGSNAKNRGKSKDHDAAQGQGRYSRTSWWLPDLAKLHFSKLTSIET